VSKQNTICIRILAWKGNNSMLDPIVLATITSAVSLLGHEYLKGAASEAGKATWSGIKSVFGWNSDPAPAEIPHKTAEAITASPELAEQLLVLLKNHQAGSATAIVGQLHVSEGGKVVIGQNIQIVNM
jgi:hypothetical protein